jgi:hypothetical protein
MFGPLYKLAADEAAPSSDIGLISVTAGPYHPTFRNYGRSQRALVRLTLIPFGFQRTGIGNAAVGRWTKELAVSISRPQFIREQS